MTSSRAILNVCNGILMAGIFIAALGGCTTVTVDCDTEMAADGKGGKTGICRSTDNSGSLQADNGTCTGGKKCSNPGTACIGGGGTCHNYSSGGTCSCQCY